MTNGSCRRGARPPNELQALGCKSRVVTSATRLKEEVDEKRYIHRAEKLPPVLPFCRVVQVVPVVPKRRTTFETRWYRPRAVPPVPPVPL